jgi:uncharacterized metal-binding protein YceD (DUF177 family)
MTQANEPWLHPVRPADLKKNHAHDFVLEPSAEIRQILAQTLGILGIRKLRMQGQLQPVGQNDWRFTGRIGATVVQSCVVTLDPVTTRIDEPVERVFIKDWETPDSGSEMEMPEDDTTEALTDVIDLGQIMAEALALALPPYPRSGDAEPVELNYTEPGKTALNDETSKPFAGLSALRDKLEQ